MAEIEIRQEGPSVAAQVAALMARLTDYSKLRPALGTLAMDSMKKDIEESRTPDGETYPPLKRPRPQKNTGIPKRVDFEGNVLAYHVMDHPYDEKPLLNTTNMYQSIHFQDHGDVMPNVGEVWAGPDLEQAPYFQFQNQGTSRIPARAFIGLRASDLDDIRQLTFDHAWTAVTSDAISV